MEAAMKTIYIGLFYKEKQIIMDRTAIHAIFY